MRCPPNLNRLEFTWKKCIKKYTEIKKFKHNILKVKQLTFQIDHYEQCLKVDSQRKDDIPVTVGKNDHCKVLTQEVNKPYLVFTESDLSGSPHKNRARHGCSGCNSSSICLAFAFGEPGYFWDSVDSAGKDSFVGTVCLFAFYFETRRIRNRICFRAPANP